MSESHLPDQYADWPRDPYRLLQVPYNVDRRALRVAYTRLIRQYKPEQCPAQFQTLRDAYETLLQRCQWREQNAADQADITHLADSASVPHGRDEPAPKDNSDYECLAGNPENRPVVTALSEELDSLWEQSCNGEVDPAYRRLLELERQYPGNADLCARLYWMRVLFPDLAMNVSPCDWLLKGLLGTRLRGPLAELYRREIQRDPIEAISPRCLRLLQAPADLPDRASLIVWRWQAAGKLQRIAVIAEDLAWLRGTDATRDEELWSRLLLTAIDQLAWSEQHQALFESLCSELEGMQHALTSLRGGLERLDWLLVVRTAWLKYRPASGIEQAFRRVIPITWIGSHFEIQRELLPLVQDLLSRPPWPHSVLREQFPTFYKVLSRPPSGLEVLDRVAAAGVPLLGQFAESLATLRIDEGQSTAVDSRDLQTIAQMTGALIVQFPQRGYPLLRNPLLSFCLREWISPEQVATAIESQPKALSFAQHLVSSLRNDAPLRVYCRMHRELTA